MVKLLLTSTGFSNKKFEAVFLKLINKPIRHTKVIFITAAAKTQEELKYVKESKKELLELGIKEENIKITDLKKPITANETEDYNVIYICGGNTFDLLAKIKNAKFDKIIHEFINKNKVYIGVSAGSIIAGPDILIAGWGSEGDKNNIGLKNLAGLNIIKETIFPHFREKLKEEVIEFKKKTKYEVITLTDNQALLITNNKKEIIE